MKIYTKTGDNGETSLLGGRRVSKAAVKIDAYGTVDELNAWIGVIADQVPCAINQIAILNEIQSALFVIGSMLAYDRTQPVRGIPTLATEQVHQLEVVIDTLTDQLPVLRSFILPGGHTLVSSCHVARAVCRRAERCVVALALKEQVASEVMQYLNRLSDYLFVLARIVSKHFDVVERTWQTS